MAKMILHCDLNCFYASVEMLFDPSLRKVPFAVGGDVEQRHGIILTKNDLAKKAGVATGEPLWQAYQKCPDLVIRPPRYKLYLKYSQLVKQIYLDYTDQVESFGIDECWLDITHSTTLYSSGYYIAQEILSRVYNELGLTLSIGLSDNKVYAKLGSDLANTQSLVTIDRAQLDYTIYPLEVSKLMMIGHKTTEKLQKLGINTIGDLAKCEHDYLKRRFGKWGTLMWQVARGIDLDPVSEANQIHHIKSVGNSITAVRDLVNQEDLKICLYRLAESVAYRLQEQDMVGYGLAVSLRDFKLNSISKQAKQLVALQSSNDIAKAALLLIDQFFDYQQPLRGLGIKVFDLRHQPEALQPDLWGESNQIEEYSLDQAMMDIRRRFGPYSISRGIMAKDPHLSHFYPKSDHVISPISYLKGAIK